MPKIDLLIEVTMKMTLADAKTIRESLSMTKAYVPGAGRIHADIDAALEAK